jgi:hypothetical protein
MSTISSMADDPFLGAGRFRQRLWRPPYRMGGSFDTVPLPGRQPGSGALVTARPS